MTWRFWMLLWGLCMAGFSGNAQFLPRFIPYKTKAGWGYSDSNKKILIAPRFQSAGLFWNGRAPVTVKKADGSEANCLIDTTGNYVVPPEWNWTGEYPSRESLTGMRSNIYFNIHDSVGYWGLLNVMGEKLIEPLYSRYRSPSKGEGPPIFQKTSWGPPEFLCAFGWRDGKMGVIDTTGKELIPFTYDSVANNFYSIVQIKLGGKLGLQEIGGPVILPTVYDSIALHYTHLAKDSSFVVVRRSDKMGVLDLHNNTLVPIEYDTIEVEYNDIFHLRKGRYLGFHTKKDGKWGWYSADGKIKITPITENKLRRYNVNLFAEKVVNRRLYTLFFDSLGTEITWIPGVFAYDVYISNDSVFAFKREEKDSVFRCFTKAYNIKKKKAEGKWKFRFEQQRYFTFEIPSTTSYCGQHRLHNTETYVSDVDYTFTTTKEKIHSFKKEGTEWELLAYLGTDGYELRQKGCSYFSFYNNEERTLYAVSTNMYEVATDRNHNTTPSGIIAIHGKGDQEADYTWKIPPQTRYQILGGNFFQNALLVQEGNNYGFVDTNLEQTTAFSLEPYMQSFRWRDSVYIIHTVLDSPSTFFSILPRYLALCESCKTHKFISDAQGRVTWTPKENYSRLYYPYSNISMYRPIPKKEIEKDAFLQVWDNSGKTGFFTPYGQVPYPALQFRYSSIQEINQLGYLARNDSYYKQYFLNPKGEEYFPGLQVHSVATSNGAQILTYPSDCDLGGLVRVSYTSAEKDRDNSFFMSPRGVVYADDDVLPAEVRRKH